jgi:hypothetical protein
MGGQRVRRRCVGEGEGEGEVEVATERTARAGGEVRGAVRDGEQAAQRRAS